MRPRLHPRLACESAHCLEILIPSAVFADEGYKNKMSVFRGLSFQNRSPGVNINAQPLL